jgi:hypothetical protein
MNLYATRWMHQILVANGGPFAVVDAVAREAQYVFRGGAGEHARDREPVSLQPMLDAGLLTVLATDDEDELLTFIDVSAELGAGEAMTAALAIHRGCIVVTDDRKASRVLRSRGVALRGSLDLIHVWSGIPAISRSLLRTALVDLRQRGNYDPPRMHPLRAWWDEVMNLG